jgi:DNA polymerase-3 subunit epsilon
MPALFAPRLCVVDLETTGTSPQRERVTEVGIVTIDSDGEQLRVEEWSSLINPGVPIPTEIQWLTGITNEMVRAAPPFAELADALAARLRDAVFIAHNARFDYGFLRQEFARAGIDWRATTLCTVRLSRLLFPDRSPHGLDAIIARFNLDVRDRHRALGDARAVWRFIEQLYARLPPGEIEAAVTRLLARPATPAHLPPEALAEVPSAPGVYRFYGLNAHPIYIGKSIDLAARIAGHFGADSVSQTDARLSQETRRIAWDETAGEIGALLLESEQVKTLLPAHNIALRRRAGAVLLRIDAQGRPRFTKAVEMDAALAAEPAGPWYGPFSSRASVRAQLIEAAAAEGLCLKRMGLEGRARRSAPDAPCFSHQLHRCRGACVGAEPVDAHDARLHAGLAPRRLPPWPYAGAVALVETNRLRGRDDWHVLDHWRWLGTVRSEDAALALARAAPAVAFDADVVRIVRQALARVARGLIEVVALAPAAPDVRADARGDRADDNQRA